jgi:hypothetical protein
MLGREIPGRKHQQDARDQDPENVRLRFTDLIAQRVILAPDEFIGVHANASWKRVA